MAADTYSSTLGVLFMGTGNDNNSWGNNANSSVFQIFEDSIANALTSTVTGGTLDLSGTPPPNASSQVRYAALIFQGVLTSAQILIVPNLTKCWWVQNATTAPVGAIGSFGTLTAGTLYTNGTYHNVPLTGGSGSGATATVVVSGGVVTSVTITLPGTNYLAGDTLSASASTIGGTGSGFSILVGSVGTAFTLSIQTPSGTSQTIPQNSGWQLVQCDGNNNIIVSPFNSEQILMPDGSASAPPYSSINEPSSGWHRYGAQDWRLSINGSDVLQCTGAGAGSPSIINVLPPNILEVAGVAVVSNTVGVIAPGVNGVVGNGTTDDAAAIQAILTAYANVTIAPGTYLIKSTLTISLDTHSRIIRGAGAAANGTWIIASSAFTGSTAISITGTAGNVKDYDIGGFYLINQAANTGAIYGVQIAGAGALGGNTKSRIFDIVSSGFSIDFLQANVRQIVWERCAAWNTDSSNGATTGGTGWYLYPGASGGFVGDTDFVSCQTVSSVAGNGVVITDQSIAGTTIGGIRFRGHTAYYGASCILIDLGTGTTCEDIWINSGCQFEGQTGGTNIGVNIVATASGATIQDIHIDHVYFAGNGFQNMVRVAVSSGAVIRDLWITDCFMSGNASSAVYIAAGSGSILNATVSGNKINHNGTTGPGIYLEGVVPVVAIGNSNSSYSTTMSAFIEFDTACDYITCLGNNAGGGASVIIANNSGSANTAIANNI